MYRQLLAYLQGPLLFHELVLSLAALLLIHGVNQKFQPTESTPRESLEDLDRFLKGQFAIEDSRTFLFSMLWTYLWKLSNNVQSSASNALVQLLYHVVDIPRLPEVVRESQDDYWKVRASLPISHNLAMAQIQYGFDDRSLVKDINGKADSRAYCYDLLDLLRNIACIPLSCFGEALESFEGAEVGWGIPGITTEGRYWSSLD